MAPSYALHSDSWAYRAEIHNNTTSFSSPLQLNHITIIAHKITYVYIANAINKNILTSNRIRCKISIDKIKNILYNDR